MKSFKNLKNNINLTNIIAGLCVIILCAYLVCVFMPIRGENKIYNNIIRLHVLANSDSQADQDLKLDLRDYILKDITGLTQNCTDSNQAADKINSQLDLIQQKAQDYIKSNGYNYNISASLSREIYPEREYSASDGDYLFPSGEYNSLRIIIGEGEGKNWWCVLFPPLCFNSSTNTINSGNINIESELATAGYSSEQIKVLKKDKSAKYEVRFKILEFFGK